MINSFANDNRPRHSASFERIPAKFLEIYGQPLLNWAKNLQSDGPTLTLELWNPPGTTVLSMGWQGRATLRCDAYGDPRTKALKMVIQPDTEEDAARIAKHCEELPAIMAAHQAKGEADRGKARGNISAQFEKIPEYFVERYGLELRQWGQNLRKIGLTKHIVLREGNLSELSPDPEIGAVLLGVTLVAEIEQLKSDQIRLIIKPATEMDERTIAKHCEKLQRIGIKARTQLVEPPRPGIPTVPNIVGPAFASERKDD